MRHLRWLILLPVVLIACFGGPRLSQIQTQVRPVAPVPIQFKTWSDELEQCLSTWRKPTQSFESIRWYTIEQFPKLFAQPLNQRLNIVGVALKEDSAIVVRWLPMIDKEQIIKHELTHLRYRYYFHTSPPFGESCRNPVSIGYHLYSERPHD